MTNHPLPESPSPRRRGRPRKHREAHEQLVNMEGLLSVLDVATFLDVHKGHVYKLVKEYDLPATRIGKHLRFYRHEIVNWIETRRVTPPQ